jgi:hypothetical protein
VESDAHPGAEVTNAPQFLDVNIDLVEEAQRKWTISVNDADAEDELRSSALAFKWSFDSMGCA